MKVSSFKFYFIILFFLLKISAAFIYYINFNQLDYRDIYISFCTFDDNRIFTLDLLNSFHSILFSPGCGLGESTFFWVFAVIQIFLLIIVFNKIYIYSFSYKKLLLIVLFFSPTILFFASPPTKDGFFISLTCIGIIFSKYIRNLLLLISGIIKPYLLTLVLFKFKSIFTKAFLILSALIFLTFFYDEILNLFLVKFSLFSIEFNLSSLIWIFEILTILSIALMTNIFKKIDILFILSIAGIAMGSNFNVASRIVSVSIFYLLSWRIYTNAKK